MKRGSKKERTPMSMANREVRLRLYKQFKELDNQYRKLAGKLKPFMLTSSNRVEHEQLLEVGRRLESKLHELQEAFGVKRVPPPPDST